MPVRVISVAPRTGKRYSATPAEPRFSIAWQPRGSRISESLHALLSGPRAPKEFRGGRYFRDCWVKRHVPRRSITASAIWHAVALVLLIQFGSILLSSPRATNVRNFELTWSGPINDLPLILPSSLKKKPSPTGDPKKPLPPRGADAFHPTQTLISAPKIPNHPRQTLVRPDAPQEPPKILPDLPNMVQWQAQPPRPQRNIRSDKLLQQPKSAQKAATKIDSPEIPNAEKNISDINFASSSDPVPERPALTLASGSVVGAPNQSRAAPQAAEPPPVVGSGMGDERIIALSASPGPAAPAPPVPVGNVSANVTISPDGTQPGVPGGSEKRASANGGANGNSASPGGNSGGGNGAGTVVPGISISGGDPKNSPGISGVGDPNSSRTNSRPLRLTPSGSPGVRSDTSPAKSPDVSIADRIKPGSPPERVLGDRTIYTLNINSPNLSSVSGSWIVKFAELDESPASSSFSAHTPPRSGALSGPVPLHKVDPRYPPAQVNARIEGEVILFAIIREDGSVDSIQIVRSLDRVLDQNAMEAFAEWKFTPANRNGTPVAVEAVVHIPFRSIRRDQ